jgi:hypothetical protein
MLDVAFDEVRHEPAGHNGAVGQDAAFLRPSQTSKACARLAFNKRKSRQHREMTTSILGSGFSDSPHRGSALGPLKHHIRYGTADRNDFDKMVTRATGLGRPGHKFPDGH